MEVFEGNVHDSSTIANQIEKIRTRFGIKNIFWITDRGILTNSKISSKLDTAKLFVFVKGGSSGIHKEQIATILEVDLDFIDQVLQQEN